MKRSLTDSNLTSCQGLLMEFYVIILIYTPILAFNLVVPSFIEILVQPFNFKKRN